MENSTFAKFRPGETSELNIVFSQAFVAPGNFAIERTLTSTRNPVLFVNAPNNDFYQNGIPAFGAAIEESARRLRAIAKELGATKIRCVGMSMGGSASIIFGALIDADEVVAVAPELEIGLPNHRSNYHNRDRRYHPVHRFLNSHLKALGGRTKLAFPAYDLGDWHHAAIATDLSRDYLWMRQFHSGGQSMDWPRLLESAISGIVLGNFVTCGREPLIDAEALHEGAAVHSLFCSRNLDAAIERGQSLFHRHPLTGTALLIAAACYEKKDVLNGDIWIRRTFEIDVERMLVPGRVDFDYVNWISNANRALVKERIGLLRGNFISASASSRLLTSV